MTEENRTWNKTAVADALGARNSGLLVALQPILDKTATVLAKAGTAVEAFTLHDADHSKRVAEWMGRIIGPEVLSALSDYELALLLLSAYLHDIGMTPDQGRVAAHHGYLLTGHINDALSIYRLTRPDVSSLRRWMDDSGYDEAIPWPNDTLLAARLALAAEIVTYYSRYKHNDWSEQWIRANLSGHSVGTYDGWLEDLVLLCRSHHYDQTQLASESFNPRLVGSPAKVVNLRYLAAVLRVADVLDFDPERTPEVILQTRNIPPKSLIFWWKDTGISVTLEKYRLTASARPKTAQIQRAIDTTLDQVDAELALCANLALDVHFNVCPGLEQPLPHTWLMEPRVHRDVRAQPGTYEYINGSFRPNTKRLLEMLSGIELYRHPMAAVRELLQNAMDAVRVQMAYERLQNPNAGRAGLELDLGRLHRIELRIEPAVDGIWLICSDDGIGMTKRVIENNLLVSGAKPTHDVLDLERRCSTAGFRLSRTGQFGIGVLSYFMIADRVVLMTRRSQDAGDSEQTGWTFETDGVGSFGELRPSNLSRRGTQLRLRLRPSMVVELTRFFYGLAHFVESSILHSPCEIALSSSMAGCDPLTIGPGWSAGTVDLATIFVGERNERPSVPESLMSDSAQAERRAHKQMLMALRADVGRVLIWLSAAGELPEGLGRYEIRIPTFALDRGNSLAFMRASNDGASIRLTSVGQAFALIPRAQTEFAWKGVRVGARVAGDGFGFLRVNFESNACGNISVSRHEVDLSEVGKSAVEWAKRESLKLGRQFAAENLTSAYASVNFRAVRSNDSGATRRYWLAHPPKDSGESATWSPIKLPLIGSGQFTYGPIPQTEIYWKGKRVSIAPSLGTIKDSAHYKGLSWASNQIPDRIVALSRHARSFSLAAMWTGSRTQRPAASVGDFLIARFSPKWRRLVGATLECSSQSSVTYLNRDHPISPRVTPAALSWAADRLGGHDPRDLWESFSLDPSKLAAWLLLSISGGKNELWEGLVDRSPDFLKDVWKTPLLAELQRPGLPLYWWVGEVTRERLREISPQGWRTVVEPEEVANLLPTPGDEWILTRGGGSVTTFKPPRSKA
jgi:hypothetical protein